MNPTTVVEMDEDSYMEMETTQIKGVDSTVRTTNAKLGPRATLIIREKVMTHGRQLAKSDFTVDLDGEDCHTNVISRSVAKDQSRQVFLARINGNARCYGHSECDAIIMDQGVVAAIPEVTANCVDASLVHEAAIGKIAGGAAHQADDPGPDGERGGGADRQRFSEINGPRGERTETSSLSFSAGMWYNTGKILCKGGRAVRTIYVDLGELDQSGALGLISSKVQILPAGAVIRTEQAEIRAEVPRYQEMASGLGYSFSLRMRSSRNSHSSRSPAWSMRPGTGMAAGTAARRPWGEGVYCVTPEGTAFRVSEDMAGFPAAWLAGEEDREMWEPAPGSGCTPPRRRRRDRSG